MYPDDARHAGRKFGVFACIHVVIRSNFVCSSYTIVVGTRCARLGAMDHSIIYTMYKPAPSKSEHAPGSSRSVQRTPAGKPYCNGEGDRILSSL